MLIRLLMKMKH